MAAVILAQAFGVLGQTEEKAEFRDDVVVNMIREMTIALEASNQTKKDPGKISESERFSILILSRSIVALGEYGKNSSRSVAVLEKLANGKLYAQLHGPDWVMFEDEYAASLKSIGRWKKVGSHVMEGESDAEAGLGTREGRTISELATEAQRRITDRAAHK
jgi:hypothetical protein